jgi:hypothetical protein
MYVIGGFRNIGLGRLMAPENEVMAVVAVCWKTRRMSLVSCVKVQSSFIYLFI